MEVYKVHARTKSFKQTEFHILTDHIDRNFSQTELLIKYLESEIR